MWRTANPNLSETARIRLVDDLMQARRAVRATRGDPDALRFAREAVDAAKRKLGERGEVWWEDGAPDYNRHMARNTPYAEWWRSLSLEE